MIANPRLNYRLSRHGCVTVLLLAVAIACMPIHAERNQPDGDQRSKVALVGKHAKKVWKLQDPFGSTYYIEMNGFRGRFVEVWFANGSGVVFDTRNPSDVPEDERGYQTTFGLITGGGPDGGFPEWIRAYRFDPETKEFDGSWTRYRLISSLER